MKKIRKSAQKLCDFHALFRNASGEVVHLRAFSVQTLTPAKMRAFQNANFRQKKCSISPSRSFPSYSKILRSLHYITKVVSRIGVVLQKGAHPKGTFSKAVARARTISAQIGARDQPSFSIVFALQKKISEKRVFSCRRTTDWKGESLNFQNSAFLASQELQRLTGEPLV